MSCPNENVPAQRWSRQAGRHRQPVIANPITRLQSNVKIKWNEYKLLIVVEVLCHHLFHFFLLLITHFSFREALICFRCSIFHIKKFGSGRTPPCGKKYQINIQKIFIVMINSIELSPPPTVCQEADELICENARKKRQNEAITLWTLFSPEPELFFMKVSQKIIFGHFCIFGLEMVTLGYWGQKTAMRAAKRPPTRKLKVSRVTSGYGVHMICWVGPAWALKIGVIWV